MVFLGRMGKDGMSVSSASTPPDLGGQNRGVVARELGEVFESGMNDIVHLEAECLEHFAPCRKKRETSGRETQRDNADLSFHLILVLSAGGRLVYDLRLDRPHEEALQT